VHWESLCAQDFLHIAYFQLIVNMPKSKKMNRKAGRQRRRRSSTSLLPIVSSQPVLTTTFRFRAQGTLTVTLPVRCFYNLLHVVTTAGAVSYTVIGSFKVRLVRMYSIAPGGVGDEYNTIAVVFAGGLFGKNLEYTVAGSSAVPGVIVKAPPVNSSASFWHSVPLSGAISGNGEPLLYFNSLFGGVIVDIVLDFVLGDGGNPQGIPLTVAGGLLGNLYTNSLDNSTSSGAAGTNSLQPVGRSFLTGNG